MKLPSSSSLLLASLAVSASSSSSLSALAAPVGDSPEVPAPCKDGAVTRSLDPQSRGMNILNKLNLVKKELPDVGKLISRDSGSAADGGANSSEPPTPTSTPATTPKAAVNLPVDPPVKPPVDPSNPPVKPPANSPAKAPVDPAAKSMERRNSIGNAVNSIGNAVNGVPGIP